MGIEKKSIEITEMKLNERNNDDVTVGAVSWRGRILFLLQWLHFELALNLSEKEVERIY